jgi:hypothetical protein
MLPQRLTNRYCGIDYMSKDTGPLPDRASVAGFLMAFKLAIDYDRCSFRGRPRTEQDLIDLNLTKRQAMDLIRELTPDNYSSGPLAR